MKEHIQQFRQSTTHLSLTTQHNNFIHPTLSYKKMHFSTLKGSLLLLAALGSISGASARALPAGSELSTFDSQFAERAVTLDVRTGSGTGSSSGNKRPATDPPADDPSTKKQNTGTSPPPASPPPATAPTTAQQPIGLPNGPKSKDPKMVSLVSPISISIFIKYLEFYTNKLSSSRIVLITLRQP